MRSPEQHAGASAEAGCCLLLASMAGVALGMSLPRKGMAGVALGLRSTLCAAGSVLMLTTRLWY